MKIYVVIDLNGDFTNVFTTKKAKNIIKVIKNPFKPPEKLKYNY